MEPTSGPAVLILWAESRDFDRDRGARSKAYREGTHTERNEAHVQKHRRNPQNQNGRTTGHGRASCWREKTNARASVLVRAELLPMALVEAQRLQAPKKRHQLRARALDE